MKIAVLSVFRDGTGYSHAAVGMARACQAAGLDVVCRSISMTPPNALTDMNPVPDLETGNLHNVDVIMQFCLPSTFEYRHGPINIGAFCWETDRFDHSRWPDHCNLMDRIWVPCLANKQACVRSGVTKPIAIVPYACDPERFQKSYAPLRLTPDFDKRCIFYTISDSGKRKNLIAIIRSYYTAFSTEDSVLLVLKVHGPEAGQLPRIAKELREMMKLHRDERQYPPIMLIDSYNSMYTIDQLHQTGSVFVSASHGEAWCLPVHDAMCYGHPIIAPNHGAFPTLLDATSYRYFDEDSCTFKWPGTINTGWLVKGHTSPVIGMNNHPDNLYTSRELWFEVDIMHMASCMQSAYHIWADGELHIRGEAARTRGLSFSYQEVGKIIRKELGV